MEPDPQVVAAIQLVAGLISLLFLVRTVPNLDKPGADSFAVLVVAIALWAFGLTAGNLTGDYTASLIAYRFVLLAVELAAAAYLVMTVDVTDRFTVSRPLVAGLAGVMVPMQLLLWTNPLHHAFLGPGTTVDGIVLAPEYAVGFWVHVGLSYLFVVAGIGLLVSEAVRSKGLRRKQTLLLTVATVPMLAANAVTLSGDVFGRYDVTPIGYLVTAALLSVVLFRGRFLDVVPVARRTAIGEMDDAFVTLDAENRVVDCNAAARDLFDVPDDFVGMPAAEFFSSVPSDVLAAFEERTEGEAEFVVPVDGERRHFSLSISSLGDGTGGARIVLLSDITLLKDREQQLDVKRQVQSRVLRHNVRNDLQVVGTALEVAAARLDGRDAELADRALETSERLVAMTDKARSIEQLVDRDQTPSRIDLAGVLQDTVADARVEFPDVAFSLSCPDECVVDVLPAIDLVFENLIENAAEHNAGPARTVEVTGTNEGDGITVTVRDDGPGVPLPELRVLEQSEETALDHGSGMGLWVVQWVVDHADGSISYRTDETGTEISVHIPDG